MKDSRLDEARKLYAEQLSRLSAFKTNVEISTKLALADRSISASVSGRVKTLDSILKKLIRKPQHTFDTLSDKVGIRVVTNDVVLACDVIRSRFVCLAEDDKSASLGPERLGYPGVHFEIELPPDDPDGRGFIDTGLRAELQVRTYAQHAWCEVSHRFDYKSDIQDQIPQKVRRRLMLTVGLLEVADLNLADLAQEVNALPAFKLNRLLELLEELYFRLTARPPDRELSISTLAALANIYPPWRISTPVVQTNFGLT